MAVLPHNQSKVDMLLMMLRDRVNLWRLHKGTEREALVIKDYEHDLSELLAYGYEERLDSDYELPSRLMPLNYLNFHGLAEEANDQIAYKASFNYKLNRLKSWFIGIWKAAAIMLLMVIFWAFLGYGLNINAGLTIINASACVGLVVIFYNIYRFLYNLLAHSNLIYRIPFKYLYEPELSPTGRRIVMQTSATLMLFLSFAIMIKIPLIWSTHIEDPNLLFRALITLSFGIFSLGFVDDNSY
jgi:hypothetical protein